MDTTLRKIAFKLGKRVSSLNRRSIYYDIKKSLTKHPKVKLVKGFRGVGKTTALLQLFYENKDVADYVSADHPLLKKTGLYEYLSDAASKYDVLFVDEIHRYVGWESILKSLSDEFPDVDFVCTGSAPLAISPDRREKVIRANFMSFSEYLDIAYDISLSMKEDIWKNQEASMEFLAESIPKYESKFKEYLMFGGFPGSVRMDSDDALSAIYHSINKSIHEDAVYFLKMSKEKLFAMEKLLYMLATSYPGEFSITSASNTLRVSKDTLYELIHALQAMELIVVLREKSTGSKLVRKDVKLLFAHPNLRWAICHELNETPRTGSLREDLAVYSLKLRGYNVWLGKGGKKKPDFYIERGSEKLTLEVGGPSKNKSQLQGVRDGLIVRDDQLATLSIVATPTKT